MPDPNILTLQQADQARIDFALIESNLEFLTGQLARVSTRAYLCRMLLLATASIWALLAVLLDRGARQGRMGSCSSAPCRWCEAYVSDLRPELIVKAGWEFFPKTIT